MNRRAGCRAVAAAVTLLAALMPACRTASPDGEPSCAMPRWDVDGVEIKKWSATVPDFEQQYALEGSGMVADGYTLYATSEKYHRLLKIDTHSLAVEVLDLDVAQYSELEGVTLMGEQALLCDEAHAAVVAVDLSSAGGTERLASSELGLRGIEVAGGKVGLEGITAMNDGSGRIYLLLERSGDEFTGCTSTVFPMRRADDVLDVFGPPLRIGLEDCNWRLTALQWWKGRLVGLKTRYPGEQYEVVVIDTTTGELTKVLDLTDLLVGVRAEGWGNNVEGLTITPDGALWLLSDNAVSGVIDDPLPPMGKDLTLLIRIPSAQPECVD